MKLFIKNTCVAVAMTIGCSMAMAKSVPGDGAIAIVELMPLTTKYEADLKLTHEQIQALEAFRKEAMPVRMGVQKKILELRGALRMAILENKSAEERENLMKQIADAEVMHMKGRIKCVEFVRKTFTPEQFAQISKLYLDGLR